MRQEFGNVSFLIFLLLFLWGGGRFVELLHFKLLFNEYEQTGLVA